MHVVGNSLGVTSIKDLEIFYTHLVTLKKSRMTDMYDKNDFEFYKND